MKGNISLGSFIQQVKEELVAAQDSSGHPFYELESVQLEVTFALEAGGGAKGNLVVLELGGKTKASQTHKAILTLKLLPRRAETPEQKPAGGGRGGGGLGGGGALGGHGPLYAPAEISDLP